MSNSTLLPITADDILDTVRESLLVLDGNLRVRRANRSFYQTFQVVTEETEGRLIYELGNQQWNIPALRQLLEDVLPQNTAFDDYEVIHEFESIGRKVMLLNARRVHGESERTPSILLAIEDVTERRRLEDERRELEARFTSLVKNVRDHSIFTLDPEGHITSWNQEAERILRYSEAEALGQHFSIIFTPEDQQAAVPAQELATAQSEGRAEDERWHARKGGERFWALGIVTPTQDARGVHTGYSKILRDLTERKRMEEALRESRDRLEIRVDERTAALQRTTDVLETEVARRRELSWRLANAQEDERRRVSRDLHDTVGQLMTGLSLAVKAIETHGDLSPQAAARLADAQRIMNDLGRELHSLAVRVRPTALDDIGLQTALEHLVSEWSDRLGVESDFQTADLGSQRLPADVETAIYRVVQEALTNVAKHAQATLVGVILSRRDGALSVVVEDNGAGFDLAAKAKGRLGLLGMRERVELLGGDIEIESAPGSGTTVMVQIPLPTNENAS